MAWSEDRLHRWLAQRPKPKQLAGSVGHDAAILRTRSGADVLCTDQTIAGVHFAADAPPAAVGHKAVARCLSDLAACAAEPEAVLLALAAPGATSEHWIKAAISALDKTAQRFGAALVGGDLACATGPAQLAVTALGRLAPGSRRVGRDKARPGQYVVLTGPVGGSGCGRHLRIVPRLQEGRWLVEHGATAMMDVSDGLAWDLFRLARASKLRIDVEHVPLHRDARRAARASGKSARWHALHDGEDHELIATVSARGLRALRATAARACPQFAVIGRVRSGAGLYLQDDGALERWNPQAGAGWRHGDG